MKRYARTKHGLFRINNELRNDTICVTNKGYLDKSYIIAESDDIDELLSGYVFYNEKNQDDSWFTIDKKVVFDNYNRIKNKKLIHIYGVIWTPKAMLYVTEFDETGRNTLL